MAVLLVVVVSVVVVVVVVDREIIDKWVRKSRQCLNGHIRQALFRAIPINSSPINS